ncbi:MAG: leucine zipper domain-containing protein, partial [Stellaceae bacterium]
MRGLTPQGRLLMVRRIEEEGGTVADAAAAAGLSERRTREWFKRHRAGGEIALYDKLDARAMRDRRSRWAMGMLVSGTWFDDDPLPADRGGAFLRPDSTFRDTVSRDGSTRFPAEPGRYQLVTAPSCPWAHRTALTRALK